MAPKGYALLTLLVFFISTGCTLYTSKTDKAALFEQLPSTRTGIDFQNNLTPTEELNTYTYRNFYNGGGVAIGDINNDGKPDIYFTGNQVENRLYLNNGNFRFEDITNRAGVASADVWSTGVSMADVNGDGWLDIYVCKSGPPGGENRRNELFINNGDSTFTEKAEEYGLAVEALSVHASFFDYDRDGDLDMYLVSNPIRSFSNAEMVDGSNRKIPDPAGGSRLFRNNLITPKNKFLEEPEKKFTDVTGEAGIYSSKIGFGLGVNIGDLNRDGWPDIYISNDFFERDYLYLNNRDGTFEEVLEESMSSISLSSMGGDIADLNHDGYPEIFISDMRGATEKRLKMNTKYSSWEEYHERVEKGYHAQFERNSLQLNHGPIALHRRNDRGEEIRDSSGVYFSEISRLAGVEGTDWSWGALIADFNLDGRRDIFVPNGIYKDLLNQDYLGKMSDPRAVRSVLKQPEGILELVNMIPSTPVPNVMFAGKEELHYTDRALEWGMGTPGFSNGAAYGDLDNDGDPDLVVNNVNMEPFVFKNSAAEWDSSSHNWLQISLDGRTPNTFGVGAQVTAWADGRRWYLEQQPIRGFQSSVSLVMQMGLGKENKLDSLVVLWPDGTLSKKGSVEVNQRINFEQPEEHQDTPGHSAITSLPKPLKPNESRDSKANFVELSPSSMGINWQHKENEFNDFNRQPLLFHMRSTEGPPVCSADVNGDGLTDLFLGGAKGQPGSLFIQQKEGTFQERAQPPLDADNQSEDTACTWLDVDGDGDPDLYVGSGGSEFPASSSALADRLYLNNGDGQLQRSSSRLVPPVQGFRPTGAVAAADYDGDGDMDLFIGDRLRPFAYGIPVDGHILENDGKGQFKPAEISSLKKIGMITDAEWFDHDADGDQDLWVVGEWMPITVFENNKGNLVNVTRETGLDSTQGWWQSLAIADLNDDGNKDIIGGNHGLNSVFRANRKEPVDLWTSDFDQNGRIEQVIAISKGERSYPVATRDEMINQIPGLGTTYPDYESYAGQTIEDLFSTEQVSKAVHLKAYELASVIGWNKGNGHFQIEHLPIMAQLAPLYGIQSLDINSDGILDLVAGGNLQEVKPQVGKYDGTHGVIIMGNKHGNLDSASANKSGFFVNGAIRDIEVMKIKNKHCIIATRNNGELVIFELQNDE